MLSILSLEPDLFSLPSGARVELDAGEPLRLEGVFAAELAEVRARLCDARGRPVELGELPLSDLHCLRAIARRTGHVPEREVSLRCSNCQGEMRVKPCSTLELGPFRDGELHDPELDAPFEFDVPHEIPALDGSDGSSSVRLGPVTVADARGLHRAVSVSRPLRITSALVRGLGVVELDGETSPTRIARLLARASDEAFDALTLLFEDAHYPPRLDVPHACPECSALEWIAVPLSRETSVEAPDDADAAPRGGPGVDPFPSVDEFEQLVRVEAERAYAELGIGQVDLLVIDGAAEVDDGGEPLLGCYRPADPEALIPAPAEIRVFYRTFANIQRDEGPYDVSAEIAETLRHELEHHLNFLSGDDPLDDDERALIASERARRVGRTETSRRASRALRSEISEFLARTWYVWLLAALALFALLVAEGR